MSVCEKCGTNFEPQASGEVTTTRVLCRACAAQRAAEKLRAKGQDPAPRPAQSAPASAVRIPAAQPGHTSSATKTPPPAPARPAAASAPKPLHAPHAKPAAAAAPPQPARKPAPREEPEEEEEFEGEESARPRRLGSKERDNRTALIGGIVALVVAAGAGVTLYFIVKHNNEIAAVKAAYDANQKRILEQIQKLSEEDTRAAAEELIAFAAAEEPAWKDKENSVDITTLVARAKNRIERERQRTDLVASIEALEASLAGLEEKSPDEIAELRRNLETLEPRADLMGAEFTGRLGKARLTLNHAYVEALHADATAFNAANPDQGRIALQRYTRAEDEIRKLFDEALKAKNRDEQKFLQPHYEDVKQAADVLVAKTYTDEVIEQLPWKDLLSGEQAGLWVAAPTKGFSHRIDGGVMTMVGPDKDAESLGLISIGDREQWRDFVADIEFTLESGSFDIHLRLGQAPDATVPRLTMDPENSIVHGKTYTATIKLLGSELTSTFYPEDRQDDPFTLQRAQMRKGAIGFTLTDGTRLKITRLRVKEMRMSGS